MLWKLFKFVSYRIHFIIIFFKIIFSAHSMYIDLYKIKMLASAYGDNNQNQMTLFVVKKLQRISMLLNLDTLRNSWWHICISYTCIAFISYGRCYFYFLSSKWNWANDSNISQINFICYKLKAYLIQNLFTVVNAYEIEVPNFQLFLLKMIFKFKI